jgi:hypothetical protein
MGGTLSQDEVGYEGNAESGESGESGVVINAREQAWQTAAVVQLDVGEESWQAGKGSGGEGGNGYPAVAASIGIFAFRLVKIRQISD